MFDTSNFHALAPLPDEICVDGQTDPRDSRIKFWGIARRVDGNLYQCLAEIDQCLCRVEVRLTRET